MELTKHCYSCNRFKNINDFYGPENRKNSLCKSCFDFHTDSEPEYALYETRRRVDNFRRRTI